MTQHTDPYLERISQYVDGMITEGELECSRIQIALCHLADDPAVVGDYAASANICVIDAMLKLMNHAGWRTAAGFATWFELTMAETGGADAIAKASKDGWDAFMAEVATPSRVRVPVEMLEPSTELERQVLHMIETDCKSISEVAGEIGCTARVVMGHLDQVQRRRSVHSRLAAA